MYRSFKLALSCLLAANVVSMAADRPVVGDYLEARNADVWTGPCFANGEMGVVGNRGVLAWKIRSGSVSGIKLDGLSVVAVVAGNSTFGLGNPVASRSVLIVDRRANSNQRTALIQLAKSLASEATGEVTAIRDETIDLEVGTCDKSGCARLSAGPARLETRCLMQKDSICGHEKLFYPTLAKLDSSRGAYTLIHEYAGNELDATFRDDNARSAVLGTFSFCKPVALAAR